MALTKVVAHGDAPSEIVEMTPEEEAAFLAQQALDSAHRVIVPDRVPMAEARKAMCEDGITDAMIMGLIAQLPEPAQTNARIDYEFQPYVHRHSALVLTLAAMLPRTDAQVDALFVKAEQLVREAP